MSSKQGERVSLPRTSMNTNISHDEGISTCESMYERCFNYWNV